MPSKNGTLTVYFPMDYRYLAELVEEEAKQRRRSISFIIVEKLSAHYNPPEEE